jgi:hypothetical protein
MWFNRPRQFHLSAVMCNCRHRRDMSNDQILSIHIEYADSDPKEVKMVAEAVKRWKTASQDALGRTNVRQADVGHGLKTCK